jgi:hypothetical protein
MTMSTVQIKAKRKKYPIDMSKNGCLTLKKALPEAKDDEKTTRSAKSFIHMAMIGMMLNRF